MKKTKLLVTILMCVCLCLSLVACGGDTTSDGFKVTFVTGEGGSVVTAQTVKNGKKVTEPEAPTNANGDMFKGWKVDLTGDAFWKFDTDIVTKDITLNAVFIPASFGASDVKMTDEEFSSNLTWVQKNAKDKTIAVSLSNDGVTFVALDGSVTSVAGATMDTVTFRPTSIPVGGTYSVKIVSTEKGVSETTDVSGLIFKGEGNDANPYLVYNLADITAVVTDSKIQAKSFKQMATVEEELTITHNAENKLSFNGVYDGNGNTLNITGNGGLFFEVAVGATVKNLTVGGNITAATTNLYAIGGLTNTNLGVIDSCVSKIILSNENGAQSQDYATPNKNDNTTGGGGIAGVNKGTISNCSHSGNGTIKALVGNGSMAAFNYGTISNCSSTATLPAGNQANSGKSAANYSFIGGMVGFNYGAVSQCEYNGRAFAQSAADATNEGKQKAIGGIVGYNGEGATVTECVYERNLTINAETSKVSSKEFIPKSTDSADKNNIGCASAHGDTLVGGLAGVNDGTITFSYVKGAIVGGRTGIAGLVAKCGANSKIENCYAIAIVTLTGKDGPKNGGVEGSTIFNLSPVAPTNSLYIDLAFGTAENGYVPTYTALTESQIATLNSGAVKYKADGSLIWQAK